MIRSAYVVSTLILGVLLQIILTRYLSLFDASPQVLLLLTVAHGFLFGPLMGEVVGFFWGVMSDASGVRLFGLNAFLLTFAGYLAGKLRRRVASERPTAQLAIGLVVTLYYAWGVSNISKLFEESGSRFSYGHVVMEIIFNTLFVTIFFYLTERWRNLWKLPQEQV